MISSTPFSKVGCRKCGKGTWEILTDGAGRFRAKCLSCGYETDVPPRETVYRPDPESFGMRFFS